MVVFVFVNVCYFPFSRVLDCDVVSECVNKVEDGSRCLFVVLCHRIYIFIVDDGSLLHGGETQMFPFNVLRYM